MTAPTSAPRRLLPDKRLALYGVAAGAAIAGASSANANLVTLDLSGVNTTDRSTASSGSLWFDVNAATASAAVSTTGTFTGADFRIFTGSFGGPFGLFASISGLTPNNGIAGGQEEGFKASNLSPSHFVGPMDTFGHDATITSKFAGLAPGQSGYLGLKFEIGSEIHYGWANITVGSIDYPNVTLNSLGYETEADTPAHVEEPSSNATVPDQGSTLALMAIGAAGLAVTRSRVRPSRVTQ
jgi:hypothetical protein